MPPLHHHPLSPSVPLGTYDCGSSYVPTIIGRRRRPLDGDWSDIESPSPPVHRGRGRAEDDLQEAIGEGSRCEVKDLYWVRCKDDPRRCCWEDEKPVDFGDTEQAKTKKLRDTYVVNKFYTYNEAKEEWDVTSILINSKQAREALGKILEGYPGVAQYELQVFNAPFWCFVHRWHNLLEYLDTPDVPTTTLEHLNLLKDVLEVLLKESFEKIRAFKETGHVAFNDLPLIYVPATIAIDRKLGAAGILRRCEIFIASPPSSTSWEIDVDIVDWDGECSGLKHQRWSIKEYYGLRATDALEVAPLSGLPDEETLRSQLIERGRKFEGLRGQYFMAYTDENEEIINERIIVDARTYYRAGARFSFFHSLDQIGRLTWAQVMDRNRSTPPHGMLGILPDPGQPGLPIDHILSESKIEMDLSALTDEQCLLASHTVCCFNIEKKMWKKIELDKLHSIPWAERAFDSLILDQGEKDLVLALLDRDQFSEGKRFDDFIGGKGQGMIMLLCGPPGVGKTLTAEAVAEHLRRPLYKLSAADVGIDVQRVEQMLNEALRLCACFGAVLLVDEADVFMEARSSGSPERDKLVSNFLRSLEYHKGIMILTTNRMCSIDTAFESRVDIILSYNALDEGGRRKIWSNFIAAFDAKEIDISEEDIAKLASWEFNGRQIKSAIETARILAKKKDEPLGFQHLEVVLKLRMKALGMMT